MFAVWKERFGMEDDYFCKANLRAFSELPVPILLARRSSFVLLDLKTLRSIVKEMKAEVQRISQHLVHNLVERDKTAKRYEERLERVTELLVKYGDANGMYIQ